MKCRQKQGTGFVGEDRTVVRVKNVTKDYIVGPVTVSALRGVSFDIAEGDFAAIVGPSGSGKTTLMNLVGGLDAPTTGKIRIGRHDLSDLSSKKMSDMRLWNIGLVFQAYNLIPVLSALENVVFVLRLQRVGKAERLRRAEDALTAVGLAALANRRPAELSGGQQQRVAIARAIVGTPKLVLADEPTANVDSRTGDELLSMMKNLNEERGVTFVFSTHDPRVMENARRIITLTDGRIESDEHTTANVHEPAAAVGGPDMRVWKK